MSAKATTDAEPDQAERVADFLRRLPLMRAKVTPPAKPWQGVFGSIPNDELADDAARLGAEWRAEMNKSAHG